MPIYRAGAARIFIDNAGLRAFANASPEVREGVQETADAVAADAQRLAPERTGTLRRSIVTERLTRGGKESNTVRVVARVFYAKFLEFGTRNMRPRPFMRPAANAHRASRNSSGG